MGGKRPEDGAEPLGRMVLWRPVAMRWDLYPGLIQGGKAGTDDLEGDYLVQAASPSKSRVKCNPGCQEKRKSRGENWLGIKV